MIQINGGLVLAVRLLEECASAFPKDLSTLLQGASAVPAFVTPMKRSIQVILDFRLLKAAPLTIPYVRRDLQRAIEHLSDTCELSGRSEYRNTVLERLALARDFIQQVIEETKTRRLNPDRMQSDERLRRKPKGVLIMKPRVRHYSDHASATVDESDFRSNTSFGCDITGLTSPHITVDHYRVKAG
jgi:hypothetical protein